MGYSLLYRRPSHVTTNTRAASSSSSSAWTLKKPQSDASSTYLPNGVPADLSFDRILAGKTCKPCSLRDFMNYLIYMERSAENLQFFLWYRDYLARFANLPESEKALSPLWLDEKHEADMLKDFVNEKESRDSSTDITPGTLPNFDMTLDLEADEGRQPKPRAKREPKIEPRFESKSPTFNQWDKASSVATSTKRRDFRTVASDAYESHDIVQPFAIQPYREEITRIVATYIAEGAPRELNMSSKERAGLLQALATTTHPSAFGSAAASVEITLRQQSHPNFIRNCIRNGDTYRITFAVALGASTLALGFIFAILFTLSGIRRGYRAFSAIFFMIGIATLILGTRDICVVLNVSHHCHLQPWELFEDEPDDESIYGGGGGTGKNSSFDSFGSSNSYEDQPWVSKYGELGAFRRIFLRERRVNESAIRRVHETMLLQALLGATVGTIILEAIFLSVPGGHFF